MIQKLKEWSGVIALIAIIAVLFAGKVVRTPQNYGTAAPTGSISYFTALGSQYGLYIGTYGNSTQVIDDSGNFSSSGTATFGTFTQGGGITASSTSASVTMAGTEFTTSNVLDYTINVGSVTLTLPASTTSLCPVTAGQERTVYIRNATTTAASNLTIAGGSGILLKRSSATTTGPIIYGDTDGANFARLDITKKANTDCEALMTVFAD